MSSTGRVIDGVVFDARREADRILNEARGAAARIEDEARAQAGAILASAEAAARGLGSAAHPPVDHRPGRVTEVTGLVIKAEVPGIALGEVVTLQRAGGLLDAEVVGFSRDQAVLMPLGDLAGVAADGAVARTGHPLSVRCGDGLLGRVLDGIGRPIDGGPPLSGDLWPVERPAPAALSRPRIDRPLSSGVRVIDGFLTLGEGQRVGIFAGSGVGKTTLLGQIAAGCEADVVVVGLVGERGRELAELREGPLAMVRDKTVVVVATSDAPSLVRARAAMVATSIAEWFRERRSARVLLLVDSLTRVARAQREVGLAAGEPPARHGFPPSAFALLPRLVERAGKTERGSITALYTVLVAGGDLDEPVADETRAIVDGHVVLDRRLAARGHWPPVDLGASVSRVMGEIVGDAHRVAAARARRRLAVYEEHRDLITLGAYQRGSDPQVDDAVSHVPALEQFLRQERGERTSLPETAARLARL